MKTEIDETLVKITKSIATRMESGSVPIESADALRFTQSILNLAHAKAVIAQIGK